MKTKTLKIKFESWGSFQERAKTAVHEAVKHGKKAIDTKDTLIFATVAAYQKFMTEQKYVVLAAIHNLKPTSLYQLAKFVDRDFANLKRDCESLEAMGFIQLVDSGDPKGSIIPKLIFDYDAIEIHMPHMLYSHHLGEVAA